MRAKADRQVWLTWYDCRAVSLVSVCTPAGVTELMFVPQGGENNTTTFEHPASAFIAFSTVSTMRRKSSVEVASPVSRWHRGGVLNSSAGGTGGGAVVLSTTENLLRNLVARMVTT